MKNRITSFLLLFLFLTTISVLAEAQKEEGYPANPKQTAFGVVVTDDFASAIYLVENNSLTELVSAPGSGRYYTVSPDGRYIGFKYIDENTFLQAPALYDLAERKMTLLESPSETAGQVSFSANGDIYYTLGTSLVKRSGDKRETFETGFRSNLAPVSPDGKSVILRDEADHLWNYSVNSGTKELLAGGDAGYTAAVWSPSGNKAAYMSIDAKVYYKNFTTEATVEVGSGENPVWSEDGNTLYFFRQEIDFAKVELINSDIYAYTLSTGRTENLTSTEGVYEKHPSVNKNKVIFDTGINREIRRVNSAARSVSFETVYKSDKALQPNIYSNQNKGLNSTESAEDVPDWVHIHQVYDTRSNWDQGRVCCGAASAMEVIASYRILPPKPFSTYGHTSEYGLYISNSYTYDGKTYTGYTGRWGAGAHGYMWNTSSPYGSSPQSNMTHFFSNHGIESAKTYSVNWTKVITELNGEYPYVLCSTGLTSGHIVVAVGQYSDKKILYVNDPYGNKNVASYGYQRNGKNAIYDWVGENNGYINVGPIAWGTTARYDMFKLRENYPQDGMKNVSPSAEISLYFEMPLNSFTTASSVTLYDTDGNEVAIALDQDSYENGYIKFSAVNGLEENSSYTVSLNGTLETIDGKKLKDNHTIYFTTGYDILAEGEVIDGLENIAAWEQPADNINSVNIDSDNTLLSVCGTRVFDGSNSAELKYAYTGSDEGKVVLHNTAETALGSTADSSVGVYVFGDDGRNILRFLFLDKDNNIFSKEIDTVNWTGWKLKYIPLNLVSEEPGTKFYGIEIGSAPGGKMSGKICFDKVMVFPSPALVVANYPEDGALKVDPGASINVAFSVEMDKASVENAFGLYPGVIVSYLEGSKSITDTKTEGSFQWASDGKSFSFVPAEPLQAKTEYSLVIDKTAKDKNGVSAPYPFNSTFAINRIELSIIDSYPPANGREISLTPMIMINFDGPIDRTTLGGKVRFKDSEGNSVSFSAGYSDFENGEVWLEPVSRLYLNSEYTVTVKGGIGDEEGFSFDADTVITFRTETTEYVSGNIIEDFENISGWLDPEQNEGTTGTDNDATTFSVKNARKVSGMQSGMLEYKFVSEDGVCRLYYSEKPGIGSDPSSEFGIWVYGDRSGNEIEFWFFDQGGNNIVAGKDTIDWTGWKLKRIQLSDIENTSTQKYFHSVVINKLAKGNAEGYVYLDDLQSKVVTGVEEENSETLPTVFALGNNYPNPFNPATTIRFALPEAAKVTIKIYDILGREVTRLVNNEFDAGNYKAEFNASNIASGVYIYTIDAVGKSGAKFFQSKKMLLLK